MASSLSSKPFLGSSRTEGFSGLTSLSTDLSKLSFSAVKISVGSRNAKKLQIKAAGSTFGNYFRVTTYGESHGGGVGCVIDGCPPRRPISEADLQVELDRRRPGQSRITTPRKETDTCRILSGVTNGVTTGTPIHVFVPNTDQRGHDYSEMSIAYRPSHADATYDMKYGIRAVEGGGRSSARETIGRVAAGAVAKKILKELAGTEVLAYVSQVYKVVLPEGVVDHETLSMEQIESNIVRCPDPEYAEKMIAAIDAVRVRGESIGGVVTCIVKNCPPGLGSPVFDKLEAEFAKAVLSLPASKGFEIGSGFGGTFLTGSEHNDPFYLDENGRIRTVTNRSGGIQGGISMQPGASMEGMSKVERNLFQGFQLLGQQRQQCAVMHTSVVKCVEKCMDTDDLFTLNRSKMPIRQRLTLDEKERSCISNCGSIWDELMRREITRLNQRATMEVQFSAMMEQTKQLSGGV